MNKRFTKLIAALALLVFMTPSLAGWGQTRETQTLTFSLTSNPGEWPTTNSNTLTNYIYTLNGVDYTFALKNVKCNSGYLMMTSTAVLGLPAIDGYKLTTVVASNSSGCSTSTKVGISSSAEQESYIAGGEIQTWSTTNSSYTYNLTSTDANTMYYMYVTNKNAQVVSLALTYESIGGTPTCATPTFSPAAGTYTEAQTVSINCTTEGATIYYTTDGEDPTTESSVYSTPLAISQTTTVKAMGVAEGFNNSAVASATYTIVQPIAGYEIDFEYESNLYTDWTFTNMESQQTDAIEAHGGDSYGTTGGKQTASVATNTVIATPYTLTCYVSKTTNNTTSSTWYIQVSTDGNSWTDVETTSATDMTKGEWKEFTANLSQYSNVYVRVYYNGSTAVRAIDDLTLVTTVPTTPLINVTEPDELAYNATSGSIMYEIANYAEGTMVATTEADWISDFTYDQADEIGEVVFTTTENNSLTARTATINLTYTYGDNQTTTATVTVTQSGNSNLPGGADNPYTVAQARAAIDAGEGVNDVYATGIVSQIVTAYSSQYGNISYNISADGSTEADQLQAYRGKSYNGENFTSEDDIQVGDIVVVYGNLKNYNGTYEFDAGNQLVSLERPQSTDPSITLSSYEINATAAATEGTIVATYANIPEGCTIYPIFYESDGETPAEYDWITLTINSDNNVAYSIVANAGEARTAYFRVHVADEIGEVDVNSELVTVSQAAYVAPITSGTGTITFGKGNDVEINAETVTGTDNLNNTWTITTEGTTSFTNNNGTGYSQVGSSSKPATSITFTVTLPNEAVISSFEAKFGGFSGTAGNVTLSVGSETVGTCALDASNDVTVSSLPMITGTILTVTVTDIAKGVKCYYISYTLGAETYSLNISAYGESEGGYYLIASPVTVDPATVENMIYAGEDASNYDLYSFDQTQNEEWRNYKVDNFNLVPGKGYLYANKTNGSFSLTGAPYSGDGTIELTYDEAADFAGWNLIGNPYATAATLSQPFYRLTNGSEVSAESETGSVNAMEGVFVVATEAGQTVTFSTENNSKAVEQVVMNVTRNRGTAVDRAIVRFDEGQQLPKFQLFENSTKLYIPQGNEDYAIVRSAAQGEMPVSFRASENGTYTIAVEAENVDMNYLHLIDNMTGADVDLLATPNYTFEARTNDYTSRFRLVFSANGIDEQNAETFAFFNGTSWTVSNTGDATLQVVDITGRIISSETINGNATISLNQPAGIYMLRLVNGNDVKVQKVVVR